MPTSVKGSEFRGSRVLAAGFWQPRRVACFIRFIGLIGLIRSIGSFFPTNSTNETNETNLTNHCVEPLTQETDT
jgi:hypothetical protein